ncbi:MAG: cobyric acid synthase [Dehalococcoidales bacterium]|nr:cobyric acid synthase [Dehalococcoidales bacterium]
MAGARTLMIQGTTSSAGKSVMVTALCRIFHQDGYRVAPFKAQNMALNSFVTPEGGEIGRAQAVQAEASGIPPSVDMNPVLLKPVADSGCQVIVRGKVAMTVSAREYYKHTPGLLRTVKESLERLRSAYDIVVIEGAGSPAEINLKKHEIANMRIARLAASPVLLVGDIDRGGVFASLIGTLSLLSPGERSLVRGFIINKFRGDVSLLKPALDFLERRTKKPVLGVVPYFRDIRIAQEDSVYLDERKEYPTGDLDIAVIRLPHISNYDDFDPLEEAGCTLRFVSRPGELGNPHLIILPGTKSTVADLNQLRRSGLAGAIVAQVHSGTPVMGICGGYQMLGRKILDPAQVESAQTETEGLGLLDVVTEFRKEKYTRQVRAVVTLDRGLFAGARGREISAYEIHMGYSVSRERESPFRVYATPQEAADYADGAADARGLIVGTSFHGLFHNPGFLEVFLNNLRRYWHLPENGGSAIMDRERDYDRLAAIVRESLDIPRIYAIMEEGT